MLRYRIAFVTATLFLPLAIYGCFKAEQAPELGPLGDNDLDAVLVFIFDLSGSFEPTLNVRAYPTTFRIMDDFFEGTQGSRARIVIGQLSGEEGRMLFDGTPGDLRALCHSADDLRQFVKDNSDPGGSPVYQSIERGMDYVTAINGITDKTKVLTIVMSDLADNHRNGWQAQHNKMLETLSRYERLGGSIALYYVDSMLTGSWKQTLLGAGFGQDRFIIESTLVDHPRLPKFE